MFCELKQHLILYVMINVMLPTSSYELYSKNQDRFQDEATRQLVGTIVLTRYNNRTYRIDDIAWDKTPQSTFIDHTGKALSFIEYYKLVNSNNLI